MVPRAHIVQLILHEHFDLKLYRSFLRLAKHEDLKKILTIMISEEERHGEIWKSFIKGHVPKFGIFLRTKYRILTLCAHLFGDVAIRIIVESIEVRGIYIYLILASNVRGTELEKPLDAILRDEIEHESMIVGGSYVEKITGERVRNFLIGFNDGLVEILGAVVGFYATLTNPSLIILAGLSVITAGAFSMAAGIYSASRAEHELHRIREAKRHFFNTGQATVSFGLGGGSLGAAVIVGVAYILGGLTPLLPVFFNATGLVYSIIVSIIVIAVVSVIVAFVSGISVKRRVFLSIGLMAVAVVFAGVVGALTSLVLG